MENTKTKKIMMWIVIILFAGNIAWAAEYYSLTAELGSIKTESAKSQLNGNVLNFTKLFIDKVIMADKEVDFNTRLELENSVRNIKDDEVMLKWQAFIDAKTETDAQNRVKELLGILITKIKI